LDDIRSRKLDVIVVYKVDRLTRSLESFWFRLKHIQRCGDSWRILVV
jgi:DNA invertase Pin-like site-specific DNA recombinase